jgi:hypothetical protein
MPIFDRVLLRWQMNCLQVNSFIEITGQTQLSAPVNFIAEAVLFVSLALKREKL